MRGGLEIISIEMSLLSLPVLRHSHSAAPATALPFQLANDSVTKCYPSINQVGGVMNIQKEKRRVAASRRSTWPNYTGSAFPSEPPLFCFSLKGTVLGSLGLNQGRSRILDLSSGLQMQVKCGQRMSSFFYIITARGQRQHGSVLHLSPCTLSHSPWTKVLLFPRAPYQTTGPLGHSSPPSSSPSPSGPTCLCLYPQLSDNGGELAF